MHLPASEPKGAKLVGGFAGRLPRFNRAAPLGFTELGELPPNKTLQVTFDPLPTFATAKAVIASSAPEYERYT